MVILTKVVSHSYNNIFCGKTVLILFFAHSLVSHIVLNVLC